MLGKGRREAAPTPSPSPSDCTQAPYARTSTPVKTKPHRQDRYADHINIITLGCSKNLVDSENLMTQLQAGGLAVEHEAAHNKSGIVVVNTCGFIDRAKEESVQTVLEQAARKANGEIQKLYVTGCLSERYREEMRGEMPELDGIFGTTDMPDLLRQFGVDYKQNLLGERRTSTPAHYAYLKISEGCDRPCSFCAIPLMRGGHVSRPIEALVEEAQFLASRGVKELMLIAQESTFYGLDLYGKRRLADLLAALDEVEGIHWIRLHYAYPAGFPLEVLPVMAKAQHICRYLDIPLQHAADPILKSMRRGITRQKSLDLMKRIRDVVPRIALRTTFIVGYPGETEADFEALLDFVREVGFERAGVFQYSHEEQTHAHKLVDDVPAEVKERRAADLMALQEEISFAHNRRLVGQTLDVLIDRHEGAYAIGRTEYDSPEVDNEVLIAQGEALQVGQFYPVTITDATEFDLMGRV
jgi:ribosomal protein S12 methylthiotransferase